MAKQHGSLEVKSACLVCDCSVAECVDKNSKLIRPPSGKKAVLGWEDYSCNKLWALEKLSCLYYLQSWWRFLDQCSYSSMTIVSGYCLRKMLVDKIMNMHSFTRTLWGGYSVHFVIWNKYTCSAEACCDTRCVSVFSKKLCIVVEKPFKTKCNGFEALSFTVTVKYLIWLLHWSHKLKKRD